MTSVSSVCPRRALWRVSCSRSRFGRSRHLVPERHDLMRSLGCPDQTRHHLRTAQERARSIAPGSKDLVLIRSAENGKPVIVQRHLEQVARLAMEYFTNPRQGSQIEDPRCTVFKRPKSRYPDPRDLGQRLA